LGVMEVFLLPAGASNFPHAVLSLQISFALWGGRVHAQEVVHVRVSTGG
jgi:hypothetical protein